MMKKLLKEYEAPLCDVVEVRAEGVLAASTSDSFNYVYGTETVGRDSSTDL